MKRLLLVSLCLLVVGASAVALGEPAERRASLLPPDIAQPLPQEVRDILARIPDERTPPPEKHYPVSNEWRHDLLFERVAGLGGIYIGVGADQNYTMAAAAGSEMLLLVDYDPLVPRVHSMYRVLVTESETPEALLDRFTTEKRAETIELLRTRLEGQEDRQEVVRCYRDYRAWYHRYLKRVLGLRRDGQPASWLADPAMYRRIRALHASGRIVSSNGDVTGATTVRAIGDAARQLGVPVRAVYFSNAEQFFPYSPAFVRNMESLPTDERSVVLRTIRHPSLRTPEGCDWHYVVQPFPDFLARMRSGAYPRAAVLTRDIVAGGRPAGAVRGLSILDSTVPQAAAERRARRSARQP